MGGGEGVHGLVGFFDRAIAGIGRNAVARIAERLGVELAHVRRGDHVDAVLDTEFVKQGQLRVIGNQAGRVQHAIDFQVLEVRCDAGQVGGRAPGNIQRPFFGV